MADTARRTAVGRALRSQQLLFPLLHLAAEALELLARTSSAPGSICSSFASHGRCAMFQELTANGFSTYTMLIAFVAW
jgi:hypothetical protein